MLIAGCALPISLDASVTYGGVEFPNGEISFADEVIRYDGRYNGDGSGGGTPSTKNTDPERVLGVPGGGSLALGLGGLVEVRFTDNILTNSGDGADDLWIFEVGDAMGGETERTYVAVLPTPETLALPGFSGTEGANGFFKVGSAGGATDGIDLDKYFPGFAPGQLRFTAVQLIDRDFNTAGSGTHGADIDAVGAIGIREPSDPIKLGFKDVRSGWQVSGGTWEIGAPTSGPSETHDGSENLAATVLDGNYSEGARGWLTSPSFVVPDAEENPRLRYWHWYSHSSNDFGEVRISEDGFTTWTTLSPRYSGNGSGVWSRPSLDLTPFAGKSVQISLYFESNPNRWGDSTVSSGWYIDEVEVVTGGITTNNPETFEDGLGDWHATHGIWQVGEPAEGVGPGASHDGSSKLAGTVLAGNYSDNLDSSLVSPPYQIPNAEANPRLRFWHWFRFSSDDSARVRISDDGGATWQDLSPTYTGNSSGVWSRPSLDLSSFAGKKVLFIFSFSSRVNRWGDSTVSSGWYFDDVQVVEGPITTNNPETFEDGLGDWHATHGIWQVGESAEGVGPGASHDGSSKLAGTVLAGNYSDNLDSSLISPPYQIPNAEDNPRLRFWHWFRFSSDDSARVRISDDGGATWQDLSPTYTGNSSGVWSRPSLDLSSFAGKKVLFIFSFSSRVNRWGDSTVSSGWYLDNVEIESDAVFPEIAIESPPASNLPNGSSLDLGSLFVDGVPQPRTLVIRNTGDGPLLDLGAAFAPGSSPAFEFSPNLPGSLAPGESATLTLSFNPIEPGDKEATLIISSNDEDERELTLTLHGTGLTALDVAQKAYLKAGSNTSGAWYGTSVSISGDTAVVGASQEGQGVAAGLGEVFVYVRDGETWNEQAVLRASNEEAGDYFGSSVALSGDLLIVGAHGEDSASSPDDNTAPSAGAAYVFLRRGDSWTQEAYLKAPHPGAGDIFGSAVAISGRTAVIGAAFEDSAGSNPEDNSLSNSGAAYVFTREQNGWQPQSYLKASNAGEDDQFAFSVGISGDTIVAGALSEDGPQDDMSDTGAVYVFDRQGGEWTEQDILRPTSPDANDLFGYSVAVSLDTILVGAIGEASRSGNLNGDPTNNDLPASGAAFLFAKSGGS